MTSQTTVDEAVSKLKELRQKLKSRLFLPAAEEIAEFSITIEDFMKEMETATMSPDTPVAVQQAFKQFLFAGQQLLMIAEDHNDLVATNNIQVNQEIQELEKEFDSNMANDVLRKCNYSMAVSFTKLTEKQVTDVIRAFKELPFEAVSVLENKVQGIYVKENHPYMSDDVVKKLTDISGESGKYVKSYMQRGPFSVTGITNFVEKNKRYFNR